MILLQQKIKHMLYYYVSLAIILYYFKYSQSIVFCADDLENNTFTASLYFKEIVIHITILFVVILIITIALDPSFQDCIPSSDVADQVIHFKNKYQNNNNEKNNSKFINFTKKSY